MNKKPIVSVCIPCFNSQETIEQTIHCVLNQTYQDIEIVIYDNCSNDNTLKIIRAITDERIKIITNDSNIGIINNFQKALTHATGEYIKFLCADDIISPDCIEKQVDVFLQHPNENIAMVISDKNVINKNGKILFKKGFPGRQGLHEGIKSVQTSIWHGTNVFGEPGCALINNQIAQQTTGFQLEENLTYVMDLNFFCQLLKKGNLYVLKEPLFSFRVIPSSGTAHFKWSQAKIFCQLIDKYHKEKTIPLSFCSRFTGKVFAWLMCIARNIVFKFSK